MSNCLRCGHPAISHVLGGRCEHATVMDRDPVNPDELTQTLYFECECRYVLAAVS